MNTHDLSALLSTKTLSSDDWDAIKRIRAKRDDLGVLSLTSEQYQNDILDTCYRAMASHGGPIVELGICEGSLSCQLAYLAKKFNRKLILVDISVAACASTEKNLRALDLLGENVEFICGTVSSLFNSVGFPDKPPCFFVVDADHTHKGVLRDLCYILANIPDVPVVGFHDYNVVTDEEFQIQNPDKEQLVYGVKQALFDVIRSKEPLHPIGIIATLPTGGGG